MALWLTFGTVLILIFLSALLSASEIALIGSSRSRIHHLVKKKNLKASIVEKLLYKLEPVIGAILLGNTFLNILATTLMTGALIKIFGEKGIVYATLCMMFIILLFAEVMPKLYAVRYPEKSALFLSFFISKLIILLKPFTIFIQKLSQIIWKLAGINLNTPKNKNEHEENLRGAIELHRNEEPETHEESHMLKSILDLDDVTVNEILIHRKDMVTINIDQPTDNIINYILSSPYTRYPMWEKTPENIIGILHARDVLKALRTSHTKKTKHIDLRPLLSQPWYIPKSTSLFDQLQAFRKKKEHFAFVIDEYGALQGIITLEDILEEIVGEINDEHDTSSQISEEQADGSLVIKGHTTLRDLNRKFSWDLPDNDATTLAGLVLYTCRIIPKEGQEVQVCGFRIVILERQRNQLTKLKIYPSLQEK